MQEGANLIRTQQYKDGKIAAKPGIHFTAIEDTGNDYYLFPEHPEELYSVLRHSWVLVRKKIPDVVVLEGLKLPSCARSAIFNSQYCSLFFRPWTLLTGSMHVPHLSVLGLRQDSLRKLYEQRLHSQLKIEKRVSLSEVNNNPSVFEQMDWAYAWDDYIRGCVVSRSAAVLIQSFLLKTMAASGQGGDSESDADESDGDNNCEVPRLQLPASKLQELLAPPCKKTESADGTNENASIAEQLIANSKKKIKRKKGNDYERSMQIGQAVWSTPTLAGAADERDKPGNMYEDTFDEHIAALSESRSTKNSFSAPFDEKRNAAATWNRSDASSNLDTIMKEILSRKKPPNKEQAKFLKHFVTRLKVEVLEQQQRKINQTQNEPLLDLVHGFPGTGKSATIAWMRELMERGLGWEHGVQFVCLAFQNAMAAQINGFTIHHWSGIPVRMQDEGGSGNKHKQSIKCQALRVIIIDEVSMISAELLGALENVVKTAVRTKGTYKKRSNGDTRLFGGVNIVMLGDFWQLHPVSGTYLASDPDLTPGYGLARNSLNLFWGQGPDTIRNFWSLTELMRCKDRWYNEFLTQCRRGDLKDEMYAFLHGLPTFKSPCSSCACNRQIEHDPLLGSYRADWKTKFLQGEKDMASYIRNTEKTCVECTEERRRRHRVLSDLHNIPSSLTKPPYTSAPALYSFNVPRYFSSQLRAREFAKQNNVQLTWCYAKDVPLYPGDRELKADALQDKLFSWLRRHDQDTCHLPSILPLAKEMPIRLTESLDREKQLYRGRRGFIYGWTLARNCIPVDVGGEFLLDRLPTVIYLIFPEAKWQIGKLPVRVYPLKPRSRTWKVNKYTGIEARRTGFWILPDFGSTAHMIQGATLDAAFVDPQDVANKVGLTLQIAVYVCLSRVKELLNVCVLQPLSPLLFKRGPPTGPHRLIRKLDPKDPLTTEGALDEWRREAEVVENDLKDKDDPMKAEHICTSCYLTGKQHFSYPAKDFGVTLPTEFYTKYVAQGCWTRCLNCQKKTGAVFECVSVPNISHPAEIEEESVCKICFETGVTHPWKGNLSSGTHGCSACDTVHKSSIFALKY